MGMSLREEQLLDEIAYQLSSDDPRLAAVLSWPGRARAAAYDAPQCRGSLLLTHAGRQIVASIVLGVMGAALVMAGLLAALPAVATAGLFVLMLATVPLTSRALSRAVSGRRSVLGRCRLWSRT